MSRRVKDILRDLDRRGLSKDENRWLTKVIVGVYAPCKKNLPEGAWKPSDKGNENAYARDIYNRAERIDAEIEKIGSEKGPQHYSSRYREDDYIRPMFNESIAIKNHMAAQKFADGYGSRVNPPSIKKLVLGCKARVTAFNHALSGKVGRVVEFCKKRLKYRLTVWLQTTYVSFWVSSEELRTV
jgi:hypothetical protein